MRRKPNEYWIEDHLEPDFSNIDPRAFLNAYIYLWRTNHEEVHRPLMTGNLILPVRFIEFTLANSRLVPIGGEQCVKFQCSVWEAMPVYYTDKKPDYRGHVNTMFRNLLPPLDHIYNQLVTTRNQSNRNTKEINAVDRWILK